MANRNNPAFVTNTGEPLPARLTMPLVCYALILTVVLAPLALFLALHFSKRAEQTVFAHYYFIRTTVGLLVIGCCVGGLMVLMGADFSSSLILAGLAVFALTGFLTIARCVSGGVCALLGKAPRNYETYLA